MLRLIAGGIAMAFVAMPALSQATYPERPVRIIVPFAAGGATDVAARLLASELTKSFRQQVVVENKVGASGTIGIDAVAKSRPDGYTLGIAGVGPSAIIPYLDEKPPYDPARDLDNVGRVNIAEFILCARPDLPQKTLAAFLADAKASPDKFSFGSVGVASPNHILQEEIARRAGAQMLHVPYNGEAPIIPALMTGQLDIAYITVAAAARFIQDGKLKALAAGGPQRAAAFPDVPTVAEAMNWPDYTAYSWTTLVAAKGTPGDIIARINTALNAALEEAQVKERMSGLGLVVTPGSVADAQSFVEKEIAKYRKLVSLNRIKRQ